MTGANALPGVNAVSVQNVASVDKVAVSLVLSVLIVVLTALLCATMRPALRPQTSSRGSSPRPRLRAPRPPSQSLRLHSRRLRGAPTRPKVTLAQPPGPVSVARGTAMAATAVSVGNVVSAHPVPSAKGSKAKTLARQPYCRRRPLMEWSPRTWRPALPLHKCPKRQPGPLLPLRLLLPLPVIQGCPRCSRMPSPWPT